MARRSHDTGRRARRFSPLERIGQGVERMLGREPVPAGRRRAWLPKIRVDRHAGEIVIRVDSPEIDPRRIHVRLSGKVLTLSGAGLASVSDPPYHAFKRSIILPDRVDPSRVSAQCDDRLLTLRIRTSEPRPALRGTARKVSEIMTRDVLSVTPGTSIREAADLLGTFDIGSMPVCRDDEVVGILTDRDIAVRVTAKGLDPVATRVGDVMTRDVITCREDDDLLDVEQIMHDRQIRRVPVVGRGDRLIGYLTMAKIARRESDLRSGHVLRGISQPARTGGPGETDAS